MKCTKMVIPYNIIGNIEKKAMCKVICSIMTQLGNAMSNDQNNT